MNAANLPSERSSCDINLEVLHTAKEIVLIDVPTSVSLTVTGVNLALQIGGSRV